jgi:hypothetical protein
MRRIVLFLISSILTPATLAAGQATCFSATQIKITSAVPADDSTTGLTVISDSSGSCVARPVEMPLRAVASRQALASPLSTTKSNTVAVVESLLSRLGWAEPGQSATSTTSAELRRNYGHSRRSSVADSVDASRSSFSAERSDNAVLRF